MAARAIEYNNERLTPLEEKVKMAKRGILEVNHHYG
jgi:hypothetical protein